MQVYNFRISGTFEATGLTALATLINGSVQAGLLTEIDLQGMGTSSAANEGGIYRIGTAGVTGSSAISAVPTNAGYSAWAGTAFAAYSTQPLKGVLLQNTPLNANGQRYMWKCNPNLNNALNVPAGNVAAASIGLFTISGSSAVSGRLQMNAI